MLDDEHGAWWDDGGSHRTLSTQLLPAQNQTIIASNDSPDIPFRLFARQEGLDQPLPPLATTAFHPPRARNGQLPLF